jgi:uncharacterized protein YgiM (DUF1202 family)
MSIFRNLFFAFALLAVSGCAPTIPVTGSLDNSVKTLPTAHILTQQPTLTVQPSLTPSPPPTTVPFTPFKAVTQSDYVNVRTNPGILFGVSMNVPSNTAFTVLGKTPGGDWIYVLTPSNTNGWISAKLLKGDQDLSSAPTLHPDNVQLISGRVADGKGIFISGITFAITQGAVHIEVMTGQDGSFYMYLPTGSSGEWTISYTGIDCSSNLMDAKCNCKSEICGAVNPPNISIQVPESKPLEFLWK